MDFNRNADKLDDCLPGLSYSQAADVDNGIADSTTVLSLAEAKLFMKLDTDTTDDALITMLISAAVNICEHACGTNFTARAVTAIINNMNGGAYLPYGPIGVITSVTDIEGNAIASDGYRITGNKWKQVQYPQYDYLQVVYTGGFSTLPKDYLNAVKAQVLFLYENRGDGTTGLSPIAQQILSPLSRV